MALTEAEIYNGLAESFGAQGTKMFDELITARNQRMWAEKSHGLATKDDIRQLSEEISEVRLDLERLKTSVERGFSNQLKWLLSFMGGIFVTMFGCVIAVLLKL